MEKLFQFTSEFAFILLPTALGLGGAYFLLPQVRRSRPLLGAILGGTGLLLTGWFMVNVAGPLPETILFFAFGGVAVLGGGLLISQKNPVHAALSFALVVLATCGIFLLNAAPFLMAATIIVYAGAIVVTFLFVIMLAQQAGISDADQRAREPFLASLAGFVLIGSLLCVLHRTYQNSELNALMDQLDQVAQATTANDVKKVLGDPATVGHLQLVEKLRPFLGKEHGPDIDNLEGDWSRMDVASLARRARGLCALRLGFGSLVPSGKLPLSTNSGRPANKALDMAKDGTAIPPRLPAQNVAAIGKSLFSDYLVPVELAGVLLLVATIGAIAIAGRRPEGLR